MKTISNIILRETSTRVSSVKLISLLLFKRFETEVLFIVFYYFHELRNINQNVCLEVTPKAGMTPPRSELQGLKAFAIKPRRVTVMTDSECSVSAVE